MSLTKKILSTSLTRLLADFNKMRLFFRRVNVNLRYLSYFPLTGGLLWDVEMF